MQLEDQYRSGIDADSLSDTDSVGTHVSLDSMEILQVSLNLVYVVISLYWCTGAVCLVSCGVVP